MTSAVSLPPFLFPPGTEQTEVSSYERLFRDGQPCAALVLGSGVVLTECQRAEECRMCREPPVILLPRELLLTVSPCM